MRKRQDTVSVVHAPNILSLAKVQEAGRSETGPVTSSFRWQDKNLSDIDKKSICKHNLWFRFWNNSILYWNGSLNYSGLSGPLEYKTRWPRANGPVQTTCLLDKHLWLSESFEKRTGPHGLNPSQFSKMGNLHKCCKLKNHCVYCLFSRLPVASHYQSMLFKIPSAVRTENFHQSRNRNPENIQAI